MNTDPCLVGFFPESLMEACQQEFRRETQERNLVVHLWCRSYFGWRWAALCLLGLAVGACVAHPTGSQRFEYFRIQMGTRVQIILYADSEELARQAATAAFERIQNLDEILTDYNPESELMRLCREASRRPVPVSGDLLSVLDRSLGVSRITDGAFDVTVGPLVALWREARRTKRLPERRLLAAARARVGYKNVLLDREIGSIKLRISGMKLDVGGIAKGYAADQALAVLKGHGILRALVAAGGDIAVSGAPPGKVGWTIAVQSPAVAPGEKMALILHDCGVSTSGDTEQFVEIRGARYSHIVDPKTGRGVRHSATVTVIAPDDTSADALATALSVLPPKQGLKVAESQPGVAALIVARNGDQLRSYVSRRMQSYMSRH